MEIGTDDPIDACLCQIEQKNFPNQELLDALKLLKQIIDKIDENPTEEKFRKLNKENAKLQDKLFKFEGISMILGLIGFHEDDNQFLFEPKDYTMYAIEKASKLLANRIRSFKVMIPIEAHPKYNLIKARQDEKKALDEHKQKLVQEFEANKKGVWSDKHWDPEKFNFKPATS